MQLINLWEGGSFVNQECILNDIGIGITTKDRWDELYRTLGKIEEFGLGGNETIVMDDASREPAPKPLRDRFPRVRFERSETPRFITGQRNNLARLLSTSLFLQLDDDSFPVLGDLSNAAAWLASHDDALALAFVVTDGGDYAARIDALPHEPFRCHHFLGCAGLINRELFLALGGYQESFEYSCEEIGLTLNGQHRGLSVYQYAGVVVQHNPSPRSRDQSHRSSLLIRNELLVAGLYYPLPFLLIRSPLFVLKALIRGWVPREKVLLGAWNALRMSPKITWKRKAISMGSFWGWNWLPGPIEFKVRFEALAQAPEPL